MLKEKRIKVGDLLESKFKLSQADQERMEKEIDLDKHWLMSAACAEWINPIEDDEAFCQAEWNFMQYWYTEKGFQENDWRYVRACGYEDDQFSKSTKKSKVS